VSWRSVAIPIGVTFCAVVFGQNSVPHMRLIDLANAHFQSPNQLERPKLRLKSSAASGTGCNATFDYTIGQAVPQPIICEFTTTASASFTVTTSVGWIHVSPSSGTFSPTPTDLHISVDVSGKGVGTYSGTFTASGPTLAATTSNITLVISSGGGSAPLTITTSAILPAGAVNSIYSTSLVATGGTRPYVWSVISGALPSGVTMTTAGQLSGTPATSGPFSFCAKVVDAASESATGCFTLSIAQRSNPISINPVGTITGKVGQAISTVQLTASGGISPYQWSGSNLPSGVAVSSQGQISGIPQQQATTVSVITIVDSVGATTNTNATFVIGPEDASEGTNGCNATFTYTIGQGVPAPQACEVSTAETTTFTVTVSDPWIQVSPTSGTLGPTPLDFRISVTADNKQPNTYRGTFTLSGPQLASQTAAITLVVNSSPVTVNTPPTLPYASQGTPYSQPLSVSGGTPPYAWSVAPGSSLPPGFNLNSAGSLSGAPNTSGTYVFTLLVTDSAHSSVSVPLSVYVPPTSPNAALPHFAAGAQWTTGFYVINSGSKPAGFLIQFYGDTGSPALLPFDQSKIAALSDVLPARGLNYYEAGSAATDTVGGWAAISADASITIQGLFRQHAADGNYYEAAVPAISPGKHFRMPFDASAFAPTNSQIATGFAIANTDATNPASIACTAQDSSGSVIPDGVLVPQLSPLGHWADYQFPALTGKRGTLDCVSSTPVAPLGLRFLGSYAFSSLVVIAE
jgi:hypothetical protein